MSESTKRTAEEKISWEGLQQLMDEDTVLSVQIKGVVNAGVIAYVQGVRGFIPASQLSTSYAVPVFALEREYNMGLQKITEKYLYNEEEYDGGNSKTARWQHV